MTRVADGAGALKSVKGDSAEGDRFAETVLLGLGVIHLELSHNNVERYSFLARLF